MRVAIAAEGTRGDIHPMLALAAALERRGHDVVVCAPPNFRSDTESRGLAFHAVGRDTRVYLETEAAALHSGALAMTSAGERYFLRNLPAQIRDLVEGARDADLIVGAGSQLAAFSVAEHVGADYRMCFYDPAVMRSREQPPALLPWASMPRWLGRVTWYLLLAMMDLRVRPALNRERKILGLPPVTDVYERMVGRRPLLAAEDLIAPPPGDAPPDLRVIGCLHPFDAAPLPEKLEDFLAAGEPPVYIGFGSMTDPAPVASTKLVLDAVRRAGVRAVLSEGWAGLGEGPLSSEVMVVGNVPHASLFQRVSTVIHHGGAGTTTTAARAGAPQIVVPHVLDQFHWARRVHMRGIGPPPLSRRRLSAEPLAQAIRATVDSELLAENAARLGEQLRDALSRRGDPADVIA
jgi:UDP:flavonoid glycosyltransferase YjiC (YdhE family)